MRVRLMLALAGLGVATSVGAIAAPADNGVPATWPKRVVLDWGTPFPGDAWVRRQLPQAHPLLVGRIQIDVPVESQAGDAVRKVPAARGDKPLLLFPPDPFVHDALRAASRYWFVPDDRCAEVLELDARILHLRHHVEANPDGRVRVVVEVATAVTARWESGSIVSGHYDGRSASAWIPPNRSRYQRFAYPDSLFYPSLYGRVLQAALQRAFGRAMGRLTDRLRARPALRCLNLFPGTAPAGQGPGAAGDPGGS